MASTSSPHKFIYNGDFPKLIRESGFIFDSRKNNSRIDWNEIRAIDIERLVVERDFRTIDTHIYEVLNCQLDTEFDLRILDSGFVKLFRLAQLSVEYLLQCRRQLDIIISSTKDEAKQLREEKEYLKRQMNSKEDEIRKLSNKVRKRHKSTGIQKYDEISEFLKNLVLNGSTNTTLSVGEQNLAALYKCVHCEKLFLNQFFLQAHITRRHSHAITANGTINSVDDENDHVQPQDSDYKKMTEKLYREIEEMRERLSAAEKRHFDELLKPKNKNDEIQKEDIESNEKITSVQVSYNAQSTSKDVNDTCDVIGGENIFTKEMFEEWKKQEQVKYVSEMETIKTKLFESMNQMKDNIVESTEKHDKDENSEKLAKITAALKTQQEEVISLKEQLLNKEGANDSEITTKLESQEKLWKSKMQSLEEKYIQIINELKLNMSLQEKETQLIQQQYQVKLETMEKNLKQQILAMDEQSRKLEKLSSTRSGSSDIDDHIQRVPQNIPGLKKQNLFLVESQEALPPYEENASTSYNNESNVQNNTKTKFGRNSKNKPVEEINNISSESSSEISKELNRREEKRNIQRVENSQRKPLSPKKLFADEVSDKIPNHLEGSPKKEYPNKTENNKRNKMIEKYTKNYNQRLNYETDSDSEEQRNLKAKKNKKGKQDTANTHLISKETVLSLKPNISKAVKKDLKLLVKKRLQNVGIQSNVKGISSDDFKKGIKYMNHKQQLMSKQYHGYTKYRKSIIKNLDEKLRQLDMSERTSTSSILEHSKTSPFRAVGSLIANVKTKALNIVRSRENLKFNTSNILPKSKTNESTSNMVPDSSTPVKITAQSILAMLDSKNVNVESKNISKNSKTENKDDDSNLSEDSSAQTSDVDEESEYSDTNPTHNTIVTTAISHMPSASIEDLLNSPVRKPASLQNKEDSKTSPIKTVEALKVTVPKSEIQLHSPGRFSKSETKNVDSSIDSSVTSGESDMEDEMGMEIETLKTFPARKAVSEDNVSMKKAVISPKGVLKSVASASSLTKKKVLFDLDAKEESVNDVTQTQKDSSLDDILKMKINVWDASEESLDNLGSTTDLGESINLSTKQSPKIAEISKAIQSQLSIRNIKPPAGSINTMLQVESIHNSPEKVKIENKLPVPAPRTIKEKNKIDSDIELSDWSIDDLVNMK